MGAPKETKVRPADAIAWSSKAFLRALRAEDADGPYPDWFNDQDVCAFNSHGVFPNTPARAGDYIARVSSDPHSVVLAICATETGAHIGNVSLLDINFVSRNAEFAIIIGDKSAWGKGIGKFAFRAMLDFGFSTLNLHRIHWGTVDGNGGMIEMSRSVNATEEGRRRQAVFKNGAYRDILEFGLLRSEYYASSAR